jgi:hypothetical protein
MVLHDYLNADQFEQSVQSLETEINELQGEPEATDGINVEESDEDVTLSSEDVTDPKITTDLLATSGFGNPVLKEAIFSGYVFQFINFADQLGAVTYQWNFFENEAFKASIYEIKYETETGSFQGYLNLRKRAGELTQVGTVNEANNYGDSSFYFNHKTKTKTVHIVIKKAKTIYAFEYPYSIHDRMKALLESL